MVSKPIPTYGQEWQAARSSYLGASDIPAICGLDVNGRTVEQVYRRQSDPGYQDFIDRGVNSRTWWGHQVEKSITRVVLHKIHPDTPPWSVREDLSWTDLSTGLMASPDAIWIAEDRSDEHIPDGFHELIENKHVGSDYEKKWVDGPPLGVRLQCHAQMTVMGEQSSRVHIGAMLGGRPVVDWTIERDPKVCAAITNICRTWWEHHQNLDFDQWKEYATGELSNTGFTHQDITKSNSLTTVVDYDVVFRIRDWVQARKTCRQAETFKKTLDQWITELLGDADALVDPNGHVLVKRSWISRTSIDTKSLYADYPELEEKYSYPLTYPKLTASKGIS